MKAAVTGFFAKASVFLMCIILTLVPYAGVKAPVLKAEDEGILLNLSLMSDTHIEKKELIRQGILKRSLKNLDKTKTPIDAVVIAGDLTNYADEDSLKCFYDICRENTSLPCILAAGNHDIGHAGDRNVTDISREEAMANVIKYHNEYMNTNDEHNYYSLEIKGYKFIVIGDEVIDGGHWDAISMTPEQLEFLDRELAEGTRDGKPVFVVSHWPMDGINGEDVIWDGSGIEQSEYDVRGIMEKYENVVYISGHMHTGFKSTKVEEKYGLSNAQRVNGVTYLNLPTLGIVNMFGLPQSGTGAQLEVYADRIVFRPINYLTFNWFENCEYTFNFGE